LIVKTLPLKFFILVPILDVTRAITALSTPSDAKAMPNGEIEPLSSLFCQFIKQLHYSSRQSKLICHLLGKIMPLSFATMSVLRHLGLRISPVSQISPQQKVALPTPLFGLN